jgi:metal-responsive CopG/Arc/MetJ family transcriptional regulator
MSDQHSESAPTVISFLAPKELIAAADEVAAAEGLSRSDIARRALRSDLKQRLSGNQPKRGQ